LARTCSARPPSAVTRARMPPSSEASSLASWSNYTPRGPFARGSSAGGSRARGSRSAVSLRSSGTESSGRGGSAGYHRSGSASGLRSAGYAESSHARSAKAGGSSSGADSCGGARRASSSGLSRASTCSGSERNYRFRPGDRTTPCRTTPGRRSPPETVVDSGSSFASYEASHAGAAQLPAQFDGAAGVLSLLQMPYSEEMTRISWEDPRIRRGIRVYKDPFRKQAAVDADTLQLRPSHIGDAAGVLSVRQCPTSAEGVGIKWREERAVPALRQAEAIMPFEFVGAAGLSTASRSVPRGLAGRFVTPRLECGNFGVPASARTAPRESPHDVRRGTPRHGGSESEYGTWPKRELVRRLGDGGRSRGILDVVVSGRQPSTPRPLDDNHLRAYHGAAGLPRQAEARFLGSLRGSGTHRTASEGARECLLQVFPSHPSSRSSLGRSRASSARPPSSTPRRRVVNDDCGSSWRSGSR